MRKYLIILFSCIAFPQVSVLDLNGQGKAYYSFDPASIAIGDSWLFSCNANNHTVNSLSSFIGEQRTLLQVFTSFDNISATDNFTQSNQSINLLSFSFPLSKNNIFSIGISPNTKTNFELKNKDYSFIAGDIVAQPLAYDNKYIVSGGVSQLHIGFAVKINQKLSLGLKWNKFFGNQFVNHSGYLYSIDYNSDSEASYTLEDSLFSRTSRNYNGNDIELDYRLELDDKSSVVMLSSFSLHKKIVQTYSVTSWLDNDWGQGIEMNSEDSIQIIDKLHMNFFAIGYSRLLLNNIKYNFEFHSTNPILYHNDFMLFNQPPIRFKSIHLGLSKQLNLRETSFVNSISLGTGSSIKQILREDDNLYDFNLSFGLSLIYGESLNKFDVSIQLGSVMNPIEGVDSEKYMNVNLGLVAGDFWFNRNRRRN